MQDDKIRTEIMKKHISLNLKVLISNQSFSPKAFLLITIMYFKTRLQNIMSSPRLLPPRLLLVPRYHPDPSSTCGPPSTGTAEPGWSTCAGYIVVLSVSWTRRGFVRPNNRIQIENCEGQIIVTYINTM